MFQIIKLIILCFAICNCAKLPKKTPTATSLMELTSNNITTNLLDWEIDMVIMFYAPWCKYCKQLMPSMQEMAILLKANKNLLVGQFNCDHSALHTELCGDLKISRYPSIYYLGYADFNQGSEGSLWTKGSSSPRIVQFRSDLYPEAIYDWIRMLASISYVQRRWDDLVSAFTGRRRSDRRIEAMKQKLEAAERKALLYGRELEKYQANEIFDSLEDLGDPFPLLSLAEPDQENLPLRVCVAEMSGEFCKYYQEDPFCRLLDRCSELRMEPEACRPQSCPFENKRGCVVASTCLNPDILVEYKKALSK